jgi:hypothetical protein
MNRSEAGGNAGDRRRRDDRRRPPERPATPRLISVADQAPSLGYSTG